MKNALRFLLVALIFASLLAFSSCVWFDNFAGRVCSSEGLKFTSNGDGTCSVSGIYGYCMEVVIPTKSPAGDVVTSIRDRVFYESSTLRSVVIPDSVTSIGELAFSSCSSLTSIEIPDSVTSIGSDAFQSCSSLTSIEIPDSVTSIGDYAFQSCSSLTRIDFGGTKVQWNNVSKGYAWNNGTARYTVYCTDGQIGKYE